MIPTNTQMRRPTMPGQSPSGTMMGQAPTSMPSMPSQAQAAPTLPGGLPSQAGAPFAPPFNTGGTPRPPMGGGMGGPGGGTGGGDPRMMPAQSAFGEGNKFGGMMPGSPEHRAAAQALGGGGMGGALDPRMMPAQSAFGAGNRFGGAMPGQGFDPRSFGGMPGQMPQQAPDPQQTQMLLQAAMQRRGY